MPGIWRSDPPSTILRFPSDRRNTGKALPEPGTRLIVESSTDWLTLKPQLPGMTYLTLPAIRYDVPVLFLVMHDRFLVCVAPSIEKLLMWYKGTAKRL